MILWVLLWQSSAQLPDIELKARVQARSVTIEKQGDARLTVTTNPDGGNVLDVQAPKANGRKTLRGIDISVQAEARIADPLVEQQQIKSTSETARPQ